MAKKPEQAYTPMMMQYLEIKAKYPDTLIFYRLGDFYEMFFDDAKIAAKELQLVLTGRNAGVEERVPMAGVPHHAVKSYVQKLIDKGYKVAIVEQLEDPAEAEGIVERGVIQVITPGASMDLAAEENNYIAAIDTLAYKYVISYADLSTGEIKVIDVEPSFTTLVSTLDRINPREIVVDNEISTVIIERLREYRPYLISYENNSAVTLEHEPLLENIKDLFQMKCIVRLVNYLTSTQHRKLTYLKAAEIVETEKTLQIDSFSQLNLELVRTIRSEDKQGSLWWLLDQSKTAMGGRLLKQWLQAPSADLTEILRRQNIISTFIVNYLTRDDLAKLLNEVYDLERLIARIAYGNANGRDLLQLKKSLAVLPKIKEKLTKLGTRELDELNARIDSLVTLTTELEQAIDEDTPITIKDGNIFKRGYNLELDELLDLTKDSKHYLAGLEQKEREKTGIKNLKIGFNKVFGYYIEITNSYKDQIIPEFGYERKQTLVGSERYITSELKEKEAIILTADESRKKLEYELFLDLRKRIAGVTQVIQKTADALAEIDVFIALALIGAKTGYVKPTFNDKNEITIKKGKHPVVEKVVKKTRFVANDVLMDENTDVLLITGPNMGGKSTYMRELALIVIMAQLGSYVPAESCDIPVFDKIFTRIGASDDLTSGQSTFMVEMKETNYALSHATKNSLLIFDEIGRGTSTFDGMALAQAILEYIVTNIKAKTLFSTHYHELTRLEEELPTIKNVHVAVKEEDEEVTFLYQVKLGAMNKSYGINVARLAEMPSSLILRAREILEHLEQKEIPFENNVMENKVEKEHWAIAEIKKLSPYSMTPLEGLDYLYNLQLRIKRDEQD